MKNKFLTKLLSTLLAFVMGLTCLYVYPATAAESSTDETMINSYAMEMKSSTDHSRCRVKLTDAVANGDVISFYVKLVAASGSTVDGADMYARGGGANAIYLDSSGNETGRAVYSGLHIADNAIFETDGWYYIECVAKADCSTGFELSVDAINIASGTIGQCVIAGVKINGEEVAVVGFNSGATIPAVAIVEPGSGEEDDDDEPTTSDTTYINMGYLPYYRTDYYEDLDYDALTHMCLAFFNPDATTLEITHRFDSDAEVEAIVELAQSNGVKVLASYGGASGRAAYITILPNAANRATLVENMVQNALDLGLDGIDIDIEASESYTEIWNYYADFISRLRQRCDEEGLLLTTATAEWYADAISTTTLNQFDIVGVMAYDDSGANHSTYTMAVDMVEYFVDRGVPKSKIVMGLPFYGYTANTERENSTSYKAICEADPTAYSKDLSNGIAYNGIPTIQSKCEYVMEEGFAGVMIWELGQDSPVQQYSLLRAIKLKLYGEAGAR